MGSCVTLGGRGADFSFFYRSELEAFRDELKAGDLSAAYAGERLLELEKHVFDTPVLTGESDAFGDEGSPERNTAVVDPGRGLPEENQRLTGEDSNGERGGTRPEKELKLRRLKIACALKVLGVPPDVPLGRKTPCKEDDLPLSLPRLLCLARRLGVCDDGHLGLLQKILTPAVVSYPASNGEGEHIHPDDLQDEQSAHSCSKVLPLKEALQLLCPQPQKNWCSRICSCLRAVLAFVAWCARSLCCCCCRCPCRRQPGSEGEAREVQQANPEDEERRLAFKEEKEFCKHDVAKCPVCRGSFTTRASRRLGRRGAVPEGRYRLASGAVESNTTIT